VEDLILWGLRVAGAGQIALALLHRVAMRELAWQDDFARVRPLNARLFKGLFGYVTCMNFLFGLLALVGPGLLLDQSTLALLVAAFLAAFWTARVVLQLFYYRWREAPGFVGRWYCRAMLMSGFVGIALAYWLALCCNLGAFA